MSAAHAGGGYAVKQQFKCHRVGHGSLSLKHPILHPSSASQYLRMHAPGCTLRRQAAKRNALSEREPAFMLFGALSVVVVVVVVMVVWGGGGGQKGAGRGGH